MKTAHACTRFLTVMPVTWQREARSTRLPASFLRLPVSFGENDAHPNICKSCSPAKSLLVPSSREILSEFVG